MTVREDIEADALAMLFEIAGYPDDDREAPTAMLERKIAEIEAQGYTTALLAWRGTLETHRGISVREFKKLTRNVLAALAADERR